MNTTIHPIIENIQFFHEHPTPIDSPPDTVLTTNVGRDDTQTIDENSTRWEAPKPPTPEEMDAFLAQETLAAQAELSPKPANTSPIEALIPPSKKALREAKLTRLFLKKFYAVEDDDSFKTRLIAECAQGIEHATTWSRRFGAAIIVPSAASMSDLAPLHKSLRNLCDKHRASYRIQRLETDKKLFARRTTYTQTRFLQMEFFVGLGISSEEAFAFRTGLTNTAKRYRQRLLAEDVFITREERRFFAGDNELDDWE
jgi:hypothetical protein